MRLKRWIAGLMLVVMFANVAGFAMFALDHEIEHERELLALGSTDLAADTHCEHGCIGHVGHHLQGQVPSSGSVAASYADEAARGTLATFHLPQSLSPPFRPPRAHPVQS